jgi:DNA-binding CsgD family transcriptional regulator
MSTAVDTVAPISGLLSLVSHAMTPAGADTTRPTDVRVTLPQAPDLSTVLGQPSGGWVAVKEDGHVWMLLSFVPEAQPSPVEDGQKPGIPSPSGSEPDARARRVHTSLTRREREVLCLVASGATNRAIASRLFISDKTASVHVSHILTKLGATTRTEAAALAHASGLVQHGVN